MVPRIALAAVALAALTYGMALKAQDVTPKSDDPARLREDLANREQILSRQYQEFEQQLLRLKQRMERSNKQEDRDRALVLDRVLEYCKDKSISVSFEQMIEVLKGKELKSTGDIQAALDRSKNIAEDLTKIVTMLREDTRASVLSKERERLQELLKKLEEVIQNQKSVQGLTENARTDKNELKKIQESVTEKTATLAKAMGGKDGKDGKPSKGDPKAAGKGGEKAGEAKGDGEKSAKAEAKEGGEGKEPKATAKSGEAGKEGQPKEGKPAEGAKAKEAGKSGETAKGEPKAGEGKAGEPSKSKAQAKAGESSKGKGEAKGDGEPKPGSPPPEASAKGDGGKKNPNQQANNPPPEKIPTGKKQVEDANEKQHKAEAKIDEQKNEEAANEQDKAIKDLEKAKKDLEKLLRQIREEELERLLAALQARCEKMLAMQMQVLVGTENLDKAILAQLDKQPDRTNKADSLKLSDNEGDIVVEASKAIEILEAEGSAVAFPEVFQQVREDMKHVQRRLGISDSSKVTQEIERDIVDSLKEMIEALKKAKKELSDKKSDPPPPGGGPPPDQKLIDKIAELKMIRSMQIRVNGRTQTYGRMYSGETTADPNIRRELHNLSERQERIFEVTNRMAKGDNR